MNRLSLGTLEPTAGPSPCGRGISAAKTIRRSLASAALVSHRNWLWVAACLCFGAGSVLAQQPNKDAAAPLLDPANSVSTPAASVSAPESYVISPDDELDVQVLDVPEVSGKYRVAADGTLTLPLLPNSLSTHDLTLKQLGNEIAQALQQTGMVSHPHLSVRVLASRVHSIAIGGAVKKPQVYETFSKITLMDALSIAEGLADDAGDTAVIVRAGSAGQPPAVQTVSLRRLLEEGQAGANVELYPGDRVTVQRAGIVYVVGGVNRAGGFVLSGDRTQLTVLEAVALAGDLKSTAIGKKAVVIRSGHELPVNVSKILSAHAPDQNLVASDILFIPDSSTKKALHRAGEAAAEAASLVAYRVPVP